MSVKINFQPAAREEIATAVVWYEEKRVGLGNIFLEELKELVSRLPDYP